MTSVEQTRQQVRKHIEILASRAKQLDYERTN